MAQSSHANGDAAIGRIDFACAMVFCLLGGLAAAFHFDDIGHEDLWFQADVVRAFADMVWHDGGHFRTNVHPLFVLAALPFVYALIKVGHLDPVRAVQVFSGCVAGLWLGAFFLLFRLLRLRRWEAALFACFSAVAASPMFWFTCPETFPLGSLSILIVFIVLAATRDRILPFAAWVAVTVVSLSITITNGMMSAFAGFARLRWKRALAVGACALLSLFAFSLLQKLVFPSARLVGMKGGEETTFLFNSKLGGPLHITAAFFLHTVVAPALGRAAGRLGEPVLSVQMSLPGTASALGAVGTGLWLVLLSIGVAGLFISRADKSFRLALGLSLAGQYLLHLVYGDETFLYSLHFAPLLILVAALGIQTRARPLVLGLLLVLVPLTALNNYKVFREARAFAREHRSVPSGPTPSHPATGTPAPNP